jgi:N utilization substance protein B
MEDTKLDPVKQLKKDLDASKELFVFLVNTLLDIARYSEKYSAQRGARHLTTAEDFNINTKLAGNQLVWKVLENEAWKREVQIFNPGRIDTEDIVKKLFLELIETPEYKTYIATQSREKQSERDILKFIFNNLMLPSEAFTSTVEEHFNNWDDDADMMHQLVNNYIQKPGSYDLKDMLSDEKWKFGRNLLTTVIEKREHVSEMIKPKLKNWDADRIAVLDMMLMQMGVCEFLYFETIPPKVTINEYIDIAKEYSTQQSGQFVNGVLDNIHKELVAEGKIQKIDFNKQKA